MPIHRRIPLSFKRFRQFLPLAILITWAAALRAEDTTVPTILFLGDSLTAGYGLEPEQAYPTLVEQQLNAEGLEVHVINGGLSGETSAGGLRRTGWVLRRKVDILVIALGANDGLRGLPPADTEANLTAIVETARELHPEVRIVIAGMLAPPNMGADYTEAFATIYPRLAEKHDLILIPFLLDGVAGEPDLNQADGIHPTAEGQKRVAANVLSALRIAIRE